MNNISQQNELLRKIYYTELFKQACSFRCMFFYHCILNLPSCNFNQTGVVVFFAKLFYFGMEQGTGWSQILVNKISQNLPDI